MCIKELFQVFLCDAQPEREGEREKSFPSRTHNEHEEENSEFLASFCGKFSYFKDHHNMEKFSISYLNFKSL